MSEAFIVSARKYRPKRFDEVVGQDSTTQTLKNAIRNNQLAHSFLFCGSRGIGKTTIARIFAKTINCKNLQPDGEACNACVSCLSFDKNASFNVIELDAASKNSVDDIRELIEQVQYAPQNAEYKIFIIDEVHMLSQSAFNAFLKTLEEPPKYAKFILATTEKHKILPTILSRCQIYDFKRISVEDIEIHLRKIAEKEGIEADDSSLNLIAQKADGGLRDALSMFDRLVSMSGKNLQYQNILKSLNILDHEVYFQFIEYILNERSDSLLLLLNDVLSKGFDIEIFLSGFSEHIRNVWVAKKDNTLILLEFNAEIKERFIQQGKSIDESTLLNLLQIISDCEVQLKYTRNRRLVTELALLKMSYLKKIMNSSWTDLGEKKKSEPLAELDYTSQKPTPISPSISIQPKATVNKGVELGDLLKKAEINISKPAIIPELGVIDTQDIWKQIIEKYEGSLSDRQLVVAQKPKIENDTFVFTVESESYGKMVEDLFPSLKKLYTQLTGKLANFKCNVDTSNIIGDITKKEAYEEWAKKYPILYQINDTFKLDFNS